MENPNLDFLFVHVPKRANYYQPIDEFMFINYLPMGVFGLCDLLNKQGISSRIKHLGLETIVDPNFSIAGYVRDNGLKVIGMSLHWHYQSFDVIEVARKIKAASPTTKIVLGGLTASRFAAEIMERFACVDFILKGDAERGIVALAHALKTGNPDQTTVANCVWRRQGAIVDNGISFVNDFQAFPSLAYSELSLLDRWELYRNYFKMPLFWSVNASVEQNTERRLSGAMTTFPLHVGLGCSVNCSFCGGGRDAQRDICQRKKPVFRPVPDVVDTMQAALAYGYESFIVCFDPLFRDDGYFLDLFTEIRRRNVKCGMGFEAWGLPTKRFIEAFRQTFVLKTSYIALSPETGSEEIRRKNKGFPYTNPELMETMDQLAGEGVPTLLYFTFGLPGETSAHLGETHRMTKALKKKYKKILLGTILVPVQIEPGSPMFENPDQYGVKTGRRDFGDFYEFHAKLTNPFCHLGYVTDALAEAKGDVEAFETYLARERCKNFCPIPAPAPLRRVLCYVSTRRWKRRGFGVVPKERKTFV